MNKAKEKSWTHQGTGLMILMLFVLLAYLLAMQFIGNLLVIIVPLTVFLLFALLLCYKITITVDDTYLTIKLGVGWIRKKFRIESFESCRSTSSQRMGVGHKITFTGREYKYYIVTGFKVVELKFHNTDIVVQIGSPRAEEISEYIQSLINQSNC